MCVCAARWFAALKGPWEKQGEREGPGESRVKGVFGLGGSSGVCGGKAKVPVGVK